jgi:hypothetical protein
MGKLLGMLVTLIAAVCVATVIAAAALVSFYAQSWKVNKERAGQALAILQGKSPESLVPPPSPKKQDESEQPAYDQVLASQGLKARDLEQREMTLRANIRQFQEELDKIADERKRVQSVRDELKIELDDMNNSATSAGMETVQATIEKLKPKQAKELIVQRLEKGEVDVVSRLLSNMADAKRAKIIAEFKTSAEMDQIGEVLNRIRQGQPTKKLVEETGNKMQPSTGTGGS